MIPTLVGGVGLFLLGMVLLTDGLKAAAGHALRDVLARFTGGPYSAFLSGAALTALVQSSSATIVTTIGFVSAGLLTFTQSIGVIIGAAVGTTSTGWLVALVGLKYGVSALALPVVGVGALLRLFGRGRLADVGLAIAGFGLIFVGIATLQAGMAEAAERIDLSGLRSDRLGGRLLLVLSGVVMTVVMQSSSAAVATSLAAVQSGTIDLAQALLLVIGQNVGTTVTAALASLGASLPARRTALSHILFNGFSGALALLIFPLLLPVLLRWGSEGAVGVPETVALFHTGFNVLGAAVLLPFVAWYARLITRLVPERESTLTRYLDASVRTLAPVAVEAARRTVLEISGTVARQVRGAFAAESHTRGGDVALDEARAAIDETRRFLAGVRSAPEEGEIFDHHLSVLHTLDHLDRLGDAMARPPRPEILRAPLVARVARELEEPLQVVDRWLTGDATAAPAGAMEEASTRIAAARRGKRPEILESTAAGAVDPAVALEQLDAIRWVDRIAYHLWRAFHHICTPGAPAEGGEYYSDDERTGRDSAVAEDDPERSSSAS